MSDEAIGDRAGAELRRQTEVSTWNRISPEGVAALTEVRLACVPKPWLAGSEDGGCRHRQTAPALRSSEK
jgi:hypothetical protein